MKIIGLYFIALFNFSISMANDFTELSDEKTTIPENTGSIDCSKSTVKPWTFTDDKPIESPCKMVRTAPPIEFGPKLLGLGKIEKGIRLPTGAVWQPALYLLGSMRGAINYQNRENQDNTSEIAVRADVFFNLQLSATERVMLGITPLNRGANFSRYQFSPRSNDGYQDNFNTTIDTFWFEGDLGELFPRSKNQQRKKLDFGFSIGRQVIAFQDSIMMNDAVDSLVLVKNNMHIIPHAPSTRMSVVYAYNDINRANGIEDKSAKFYGVFTETDTWKRTVEVDLAYMSSDIEADGGYYGFSNTQRIGHWNSTLRLNGSFTSQAETENMRNGSLLTAQFSRNLKASHNLYYLNMFAGFDEYRVATKDEDVGGPIGLVGISFASPSLGNFNSALSNQIDSSYGLATGYQWFFNREKSNLMLEVAFKRQYNSKAVNSKVMYPNQEAISLRFQKALAQRWLWQIDAYVANQIGNNTNYSIRSELGIRF